jgi:hypothetical protein
MLKCYLIILPIGTGDGNCHGKILFPLAGLPSGTTDPGHTAVRFFQLLLHRAIFVVQATRRSSRDFDFMVFVE